VRPSHMDALCSSQLALPSHDLPDLRLFLPAAAERVSCHEIKACLASCSRRSATIFRDPASTITLKFVELFRCIPVRFLDGSRTPASTRVMLVSSSGGNGWVFPKGGWELDETAQDAAKRETVEEGGVRGELEAEQLGTYPFSNRKTQAGQKGCIAHMFVMLVQEELATWPESAHRSRRWVRVSHLQNCCVTLAYTVFVRLAMGS
jgi:8-oxo-dGTP pyrophosphatase MutT (NUDIX family)